MRKTNLILVASAILLSSCMAIDPYSSSSIEEEKGSEAQSQTGRGDESQSSVALPVTEEPVLETAPIIDYENNLLTYGYYPKTHVSDKNAIASLNELSAKVSRLYYPLDGKYYAKQVGKPYESNYVFSDGTNIVSGETYWFNVEPIVWKILSEEEGVYTLVSTELLDAHRFNANWEGKDEKGHYAATYEFSEIRNWLNTEFFDAAFAFGDAYVELSEVDNSIPGVDLPYLSADTVDKAYLLTPMDYMNNAYFNDACFTTDYARARGASYSTDSSYLYGGWYWSRWANRENTIIFWGNGGGSDFMVDDAYGSVRPAISVKIEK